MKTKPLVKEFIRFGVVGVLATALHYGIYYFLQSLSHFQGGKNSERLKST